MSGVAAWGADLAKAAKVGGMVASPVLAGAGQALNDMSDPNLSVGARAGRVAAQAGTVGGAAIAGGVIGGAIGTFLVPGVGTAIGAFVGGTLVSYFAGEGMDKVNDGAVDMGGEFGDAIEHGVKDVWPW